MSARRSEQLGERLRALRADLAAATQAEQAAGEHARELMVVGEDAEAAIADRTTARTRIATLTETITEVASLLKTVREAEDKADAEKRVLGCHRGLTSLLDQRVKDRERIAEADRAKREAEERLQGRDRGLSALWCELLVLHECFGVEVPDLVPPTPGLPGSLRALSYSGGGWSVERILSRTKDTPTAALLEQAGLGILGDPKGWETRRELEHNETTDKADQARRVEIAGYDSWLREQLAKGPVPVEAIERQAKKAELRYLADRNHPHASVREAADRLRVIGLQEEPDGPIWWAIGDYDRYRFSLLAAPRMSAAGMRG